MKTPAFAGQRANRLSRAGTLLNGLFIGVCGLVVFTGYTAYQDGKHVVSSFSWFKDNLHAGFSAEICRCQIEDARLEQCKYALTGKHAYLSQSANHLKNGYDGLTYMQALFMKAGEVEQSRRIDSLLTQFKASVGARQELIERVAKERGDVQAAGQLKEILLRQTDNGILQSIFDFKRNSNVKLIKRGREFFDELKRTSSNGALLAMLIGGALLLGLTQKLMRERRQTEETLLVAEQRMRAVVDNMFDALLAVDSAGVICAANRRASELLNVPSYQLVGMQIGSFVTDTAGLMTAADMVVDGRVRKSSGETLPVEVGVKLIEGGGVDGRIARLVTLKDISQRLEGEQLRQSFIDTATQSLQEPLVQITDSVSAVVRGQSGELPPKAVDTLRIAERNSHRLMGLLNDLLDLERLESGSLHMNLRPTTAGDIVDRSLEAVRGFAAGSKVELSKSVTGGLELTVDADRIVQVLVNFLSNAIKFSPPGGRVTVEVADESGQVIFKVIDQGRGIPEDRMASVFERFQQSEAGDAKKGTGLGLPICKMIVENHAGEIGVLSEVGLGSTFYARVPRKPGQLAV